MTSDGASRTGIRLWTLLAAAAAAWMLLFLILTKIVGPLSPDEVMFSHILWLTLEGKRQFIDFYSYHFPTYFAFYGLILPHGKGDSLDFLWTVRLSNLLVVAAYVGLLFAVERRTALYLLPLLLFMLSISRMIEVRPDTFGLLAFNAAWAALLAGKSSRSLVAASVLAIFAAACSARGVAMGAGFGAALLWRAAVHRSWRFVLIPMIVAGSTAIIGAAAYAADPAYIMLVLRSCLLDPGALLPWLSFTQRIVAFDRLPQTLLAAAAFVLGAACALKGEDRDRSGVIAIAALAQLLLIVLDPSPFPYVYGWAAVPGLAGSSLAGRLFPVDARKLAAAVGGACAASLAVLTIAYPMVSGRQPPPGSNYRLLLDVPMNAAAVQHTPLRGLVALELSRAHQQSLANQLLIREEVCRRIDGRILATWQNHPICLDDAAYEWLSVRWPGVLEGQSAAGPPWLMAAFRRSSPDLFIWETGIPGARGGLSPWASRMLAEYDVEQGFALRTDLTRSGRDSFGRAAIPPNSDHR